ncbi:hypothetical protein NMY22_g9722 [Coprinellus aureogranulatus]|nr:hypothetical protein NMY22_g9722 [Coprinellus aureogranulatus]
MSLPQPHPSRSVMCRRRQRIPDSDDLWSDGPDTDTEDVEDNHPGRHAHTSIVPYADREKKRKRDSEASATESALRTVASSETILGQKDNSRPSKRARGKRGFLQQVADMPLELLLEIFSNMHPMDLLNLARCTKALRAILMQRSSKDVWKSALASVVDLPPRPEDLTEPQWVDLLFGRNCHVCERTTAAHTQTYAWEGRIRGCFECVVGKFNVQWGVKEVLEVTPSLDIGSKSHRGYKGIHYLEPAYKELTEAYERLSGKSALRWVKEKQAAKTALAGHARLCELWLKRTRSARVVEVNRELVQQKAATSGGLLVSKAILKKDITDRVWGGSLAAFTELMDKFENKFEQQRRDGAIMRRSPLLVEAHRAYVETLPVGHPVFTAADLFQRPRVNAIMLAEPLEDEVEKDFLKKAIKKFPKYNKAWTDDMNRQLLEMVKAEANVLLLEEEDVDESSLDLAAAFFECKKCDKKGFHAADLFHHRCSLSYWDDEVYLPYDTEGDISAFIKQTKQYPFNFFGGFAFDTDKAKRAVILIKKLDLLPGDLKIDALDKLDPIFERPVAGPHNSKSTRRRLMYSWRGLLADDDIPESELMDSSLLDKKTSGVIRVLLDEEARRQMVEYSKQVHCKHCRNFLGNSSDLVEHLHEKHGVEVISDGDMWIHPDSYNRNPRTSITYYKHTTSASTLI